MTPLHHKINRMTHLLPLINTWTETLQRSSLSVPNHRFPLLPPPFLSVLCLLSPTLQQLRGLLTNHKDPRTPQMGPLSMGSTRTGLCISPNSGAEVANTIRVGCLNVRGNKANHDFVHMLLNKLDILAISEHWLYSYDLNLLSCLHNQVCVYSSSAPAEEDPVTCTPQYIRGRGGVAVFWRKSINCCIKKLTNFSNDKFVIKLLTAPFV